MERQVNHEIKSEDIEMENSTNQAAVITPADKNKRIIKLKCDICNKSVTNLVVHQTVHTDQRLHVCNICGKDYKFYCGLTRHKREIHKTRDYMQTPRRNKKNHSSRAMKESLKNQMTHTTKFQTGETSVGSKNELIPKTRTSLSTAADNKKMQLQKKGALYLCKICSTIVHTNDREKHVAETHSSEEFPITANCELWNACFGGVNASIIIRAETLKKPKIQARSATKKYATLHGVKNAATSSANNKCSKYLKMYYCDLCTRSFATIKSLSQHRRLIHKTYVLQPCYKVDGEEESKEADICGTSIPKTGNSRSACFNDKSLSSKSAITETICKQTIVHDKTRSVRCEICSTVCVSKAGLAIHLSKMHRQKKLDRKTAENRIYQCSLCRVSFTSMPEYEEHQSTTHLTKPRRTLFYTHLLKHRHEAHNIHNYKCTDCGRTFNIKMCYISHLRVHKRKMNVPQLPDVKNIQEPTSSNHEFNFGEDLCDNKKSPTTVELFVKHREVDDSDETDSTLNERSVEAEKARWLITCDYCSKVCENQQILKQHCLEQHAGGFCEFVCDSCDFGSPNRRRMLDHCRKAHGYFKHLKNNTPSREQLAALQDVQMKLRDKNIDKRCCVLLCSDVPDTHTHFGTVFSFNGFK